MKFHNLILLMSCLSLMSCAKISYVWQQGKGQLKILTEARDIQEVLADPKVSIEVKEKIQQAETARQYFKQYWKMSDSELGDIYQEFTQLESEAVVHLVTCTPPFSLRPLIHDFSPFGEFPYLGFFSAEEAQKKALWCETSQFYHSWIRPVYAYSTLGYFDDPILSSFLVYEKFDFIEMIYHELFHKYFFIRQDVDFSENIANFVALKMLEESVSEMNQEDQLLWIKKRDQGVRYSEQVEFIVQLAKKFDKDFSSQELHSKTVSTEKKLQDSNNFFQEYIEKKFLPQLKDFCLKQGVPEQNLPDKCYGLHKKWSPPIFSGLLTYEKEQKTLEKLLAKNPVTLYEFVQHLKTLYKNYRRQKLFKAMPPFIEFIQKNYPKNYSAKDS